VNTPAPHDEDAIDVAEDAGPNIPVERFEWRAGETLRLRSR
jgi:hypothetical protein